MKITIDTEILNKYNLSIKEFFILYLNYLDFDISSINSSLVEKGVVGNNLYENNKLVLSNNTKDLISTIFIESDKNVQKVDNRFENLAQKLRDLYPKGNKPGTSYPWRDSNVVIAKKLKTLVYKHNVQFTDEQAINATRKYVESFNGDYRYMQLLKYFIWKSKTGEDGTEFNSTLLSYIENEGQIESNNDWTAELR